MSLSGTAFRFQIIKDGSDVRLYSKSGVDYSNTLPSMRKAFAELPTNSAILDGELCLIDPGGGANSYRLMRQMRTRWPEQLRAPGLSVGIALSVQASPRRLSLSRHQSDKLVRYLRSEPLGGSP